MGRKRPNSENTSDEGDAPNSRDGLQGVQFFVLDEADRMLDMGFLPQVREVLGLMGPKATGRQTLMFSATWPPAVRSLAEELLRTPVHLFVEQGEGGGLVANASVTQEVQVLPEREKLSRLLEVLVEEEQRSPGMAKALIFSNTKKGCAELAHCLEAEGVNCRQLHGNLSQDDRAASLAAFSTGASRFLVATDVAARGLDVEDISLVVCYDFPDSMNAGAEDYVHRVGRTGRAGRQGRAVTFFPSPEDVGNFRSAGNAHALVEILEAAGQAVPPELRALDHGPPAAGAGRRGAKGKGKGKEKLTPPPAKRPRLENGAAGVRVEGGNAPTPIDSFDDAPFGPRVREEISLMGFKVPTPIQAHGWPLLLSGTDLVSVAKTGSGKTLAFLLPVLHRVQRLLRRGGGRQAPAPVAGAGPLALVLAPTRELAAQIAREAVPFAAACDCRVVCLHGGAPWEPQAAEYERGCELLVATPGRLCFVVGRGGEAAMAAARAIASAGTRKLLDAAISSFKDYIVAGGRPTRHILATLMNAHVQCGDLDGATRVAEQMREAGIALGVVEHTTLVKGHLDAGDLHGGLMVFDSMLSAVPPVRPDLRAANTVLRGCMKLGEIAEARRIFDQMREEWHVAPDAASYKSPSVASLGTSLCLRGDQSS